MRCGSNWPCVVLSLLAIGCASSKPDLSAERKRLEQRDQEWENAVAAKKSVSTILSAWADDAVVLPPGLPALIGKKAIREYVVAALAIPGFSMSWDTSDVRFSPDGKLAYMLQTNTVTQTGPDGKPLTTHGKGTTIWRKDSNGDWKCVVDVWNEQPPATDKSER